jgi:hypothetical protein
MSFKFSRVPQKCNLQARKHGKAMADRKELDVDAILPAQAHEVRGIVVTENVGHLALFVEAKDWGEIE